MRRTQDPALEELRQLILRMGSLAEAILRKAERVLVERDPELGAEVNADDVAIDRLDVEIDEAILRLLARWAPVAEDLRQVIAIKTMATDLERVGDLARNIAACGMRLAERTETPFTARLEALQTAARQLLRAALDSFQECDADAARRVIEGDDDVDELQDRVVRDLIEEIERNPEVAGQAIDLILVAESLERVGDHATNIAEDVILVVEARNVKHAAKLARPA